MENGKVGRGAEGEEQTQKGRRRQRTTNLHKNEIQKELK